MILIWNSVRSDFVLSEVMVVKTDSDIVSSNSEPMSSVVSKSEYDEILAIV